MNVCALCHSKLRKETSELYYLTAYMYFQFKFDSVKSTESPEESYGGRDKYLVWGDRNFLNTTARERERIRERERERCYGGRDKYLVWGDRNFLNTTARERERERERESISHTKSVKTLSNYMYLYITEKNYYNSYIIITTSGVNAFSLFPVFNW